MYRRCWSFSFSYFGSWCQCRVLFVYWIIIPWVVQVKASFTWASPDLTRLSLHGLEGKTHVRFSSCVLVVIPSLFLYVLCPGVFKVSEWKIERRYGIVYDENLWLTHTPVYLRFIICLLLSLFFFSLSFSLSLCIYVSRYVCMYVCRYDVYMYACMLVHFLSQFAMHIFAV